MLPSVSAYSTRGTSRFWICCGLLMVVLALGWAVQPAHAFADKRFPLHDVAAQPVVPAGCTELITNGGFESLGTGWVILDTAAPAGYDSSIQFEGLYSMRLGIVNLPDVPSTSAVEQTVNLPGDAENIVLSFHYYPQYDNTPGNDLQRADLYNTLTNPPQFLERTLAVLRNDRTWLYHQDDITAYAGEQIKIRFGVDNDGQGGRTAMYVDNVSILACNTTPTPTVPTGTPTSTPTSTFIPVTPISPTPIPTPIYTTTPIPDFSCPVGQTVAELLVDGSFESGAAWIIGQDPVPPRYTNEQVYDGAQSILLGNPPSLGLANQITYSSVRQLITIPYDATSVQLRWWYLPQSQEAPTLSPNRWQDRQDVILLDASLQPIEILERRREASGGWREGAAAFPPQSRGQSVYVYFNVFNDGNGARTWMFLDAVRVLACLQPQSPIPPYPPPVIQPYPHQPLPTRDMYVPPQTPGNSLFATPTPTSPAAIVLTGGPVNTAVVPSTPLSTETLATSSPVGGSTPVSTATPIPTSALLQSTPQPSPPVATLTLSPTVAPSPTTELTVASPESSNDRRPLVERLGIVVVLALVIFVIGVLASIFMPLLQGPRI